MDKNDTLHNPMKLLEGERKFSGEFNFRICSILEKYTENFHELVKMNDCQVKFYTNNAVKPIAVPPRPIPYHLKARVDSVFESIIRKALSRNIHQTNQPFGYLMQ